MDGQTKQDPEKPQGDAPVGADKAEDRAVEAPVDSGRAAKGLGSSSSDPDLQQRLRALVDAEEGALKQQRDEAETRLAQAQALLADARSEISREHELNSRLESMLEESAQGRHAAEEQLADAQTELDLARSQLKQATAGLETYDETRGRLEAAERKLESARIEINRRGEEIANAERRAGEARKETQDELRGRLEAEKALEVGRADAERVQAEMRAEADREAHDRAAAERSLERVRAEAKKLSERVEAAEASAVILDEKLQHQAKQVERDAAERAAEQKRAADANESLERRARAAAEQVKGSRQALEASHAELKDAKTQLGIANDRIGELEQALGDMRSRAASEREEWRSSFEQQGQRRTALERQLEDAAAAERKAQEVQAELRAELDHRAAEAAEAEQRVHEAEREIVEARDAAERQRERFDTSNKKRAGERAEVEQKLAEMTKAEADARNAVDSLQADLKKAHAAVEEAKQLAEQRGELERVERKTRMQAERQLDELLSDAHRKEEAVALVERRIAEALDRRLKATVELESQGRKMIDRHEASLTSRTDELARLEERITAARGVLSELAQLSDHREQGRTALSDRLDQIAQVLVKNDEQEQQPPAAPAPAAPTPVALANGHAGGTPEGPDGTPDFGEVLRKRRRRNRT
jgi:chromosome segregation ATPase